MRLQMIHSGTNRDSLVTPADRRTFDLMLQLRLQLVRCEPSSHFNVQGKRQRHPARRVRHLSPRPVAACRVVGFPHQCRSHHHALLGPQVRADAEPAMV